MYRFFNYVRSLQDPRVRDLKRYISDAGDSVEYPGPAGGDQGIGGMMAGSVMGKRKVCGQVSERMEQLFPEHDVRGGYRLRIHSDSRTDVVISWGDVQPERSYSLDQSPLPRGFFYPADLHVLSGDHFDSDGHILLAIPSARGVLEDAAKIEREGEHPSGYVDFILSNLQGKDDVFERLGIAHASV